MTQYKQGQIIEITLLNEYGKPEIYRRKVMNISNNTVELGEVSIINNVLAILYCDLL